MLSSKRDSLTDVNVFRSLPQVASFHQYVKPKIGVKLSSFCTKLTGIKQEDVNKAQSFLEVLRQFEVWLYTQLCTRNYETMAIATDCSWDMSHFFLRSCLVNNIRYPKYALQWINVRRAFAGYYKEKHYNLKDMLKYLGMSFQGRLHSGHDDAKNLALIVIRMLEDGAYIAINERLSRRRYGQRCLL